MNKSGMSIVSCNSKYNMFGRFTKKSYKSMLLFYSGRPVNGSYTKPINSNKLVDVRDMNGNTYLPLASYQRQQVLCRSLIEMGANINAKNHSDNTPLILACRNGDHDIARMLIRKGADTNMQDDEGWTALMWAAERGHHDICELLVEAGAKSELVNSVGQNAIMIAIVAGYEGIARELLASLCSKSH